MFCRLAASLREHTQSTMERMLFAIILHYVSHVIVVCGDLGTQKWVQAIKLHVYHVKWRG